MNPTPSPFKKFLVPGLVIIILIAIGLWLFLKGGAVDQGAALFRAVGTTSSINKNLNAVPYPGNKGLPCLVGSTIPQIKVMSPNGGETFTAGQQITVTWSTCNIPSNAQIAILLKDEVNGTNSTGFGSTNNDGSEMITLPASSSPFWNQSPFGQRFKIKVNYKLAGQSTWTDGDISDNLFTINSPIASCTPTTPPWIRVVSPNGGEVFHSGQQIAVQWSSCNILKNEYINICLDNNFQTGTFSGCSAGLGAAINSGTNSGSALVPLPTPANASWFQSGQHYKVYVERNGSPNIHDFSDNLFTIQ